MTALKVKTRKRQFLISYNRPIYGKKYNEFWASLDLGSTGVYIAGSQLIILTTVKGFNKQRWAKKFMEGLKKELDYRDIVITEILPLRDDEP